MKTPNTNPQGSEWQAHINKLCEIESSLKGEVYEPIPATVGGDAGLEGVTTSGDAIQCYADQGSLTLAERTRKQKDKIRDDLNKLSQNSAFWTEYFKDRKLKRWFCVCPSVDDKEVNKYAKRRAKVLREQPTQLPFLDPAFDAFVVSDSHFALAKEWMDKKGNSVLEVAPDGATPTQITHFASSKPKFVANIDRKLGQVMNPKKAQMRGKEYLKHHLDAQNVFGKLHNESPDIREHMDHLIAAQENIVRFQSDVDSNAPNQRLVSTLQELQTILSHDFRSLAQSTCQVVALGTVASWLGECPLSFDSTGPE